MSDKAKRTQTNTITLGSGDLFYKEFEGSEIPDVEKMCIEANRLGRIKGGAAISYTPSKTEVKDDKNVVVKTIVTDEEAILKTGIITWNAKTLGIVCSTARVSETETRRTVLIGGPDNENGKSYVITFKHTDNVDGNIWVQIVGQNNAALQLNFTKDTETTIDAEFKALPYLDEEGTLIKYVEEISSK